MVIILFSQMKLHVFITVGALLLSTALAQKTLPSAQEWDSLPAGDGRGLMAGNDVISAIEPNALDENEKPLPIENRVETAEKQHLKDREARILSQYSATTRNIFETTTIQALSTCFSTNTATACTGKRRRKRQIPNNALNMISDASP